MKLYQVSRPNVPHDLPADLAATLPAFWVIESEWKETPCYYTRGRERIAKQYAGRLYFTTPEQAIKVWHLRARASVEEAQGKLDRAEAKLEKIECCIRKDSVPTLTGDEADARRIQVGDAMRERLKAARGLVETPSGESVKVS